MEESYEMLQMHENRCNPATPHLVICATKMKWAHFLYFLVEMSFRHTQCLKRNHFSSRELLRDYQLCLCPGHNLALIPCYSWLCSGCFSHTILSDYLWSSFFISSAQSSRCTGPFILVPDATLLFLHPLLWPPLTYLLVYMFVPAAPSKLCNNRSYIVSVLFIWMF